MKSFDYIISLIILVTKVEELMVILVDSVLSKILPNIETAIKKGESDGLQKKIKGRILIKQSKDILENLKINNCMQSRANNILRENF